jgi:hypothetical protein
MCNYRRFGERIALVTTNIAPRSLTLVSLVIEAIPTSEMSILQESHFFTSHS